PPRSRSADRRERTPAQLWRISSPGCGWLSLRRRRFMSGPATVIVGGGVTGLSTAYHLALRRFGRITLLDKGPVGDGSSSRAAAIITGLLWSETGVRVRQIALRRYRELSEELPGYQFQ